MSTQNTPIQHTGIAWNHSRALPPLGATAQRYEETHRGVRIHWQKRTLDEFDHAPIDVLPQKFDLTPNAPRQNKFCLDFPFCPSTKTATSGFV